MLGESTGGGVPLSCCGAGCWSSADGVDDRVRRFESCDPRSDSKVVVKPIVDRLDLCFEVVALLQTCSRLRLFLSEAFELGNCDAEFVVRRPHGSW